MKKIDGLIVLSWYDDETNLNIQANYWYSGTRCYRQYCFSDGTSSKVKRISEREYISAIETYHNA